MLSRHQYRKLGLCPFFTKYEMLGNLMSKKFFFKPQKQKTAYKLKAVPTIPFCLYNNQLNIAFLLNIPGIFVTYQKQIN